jgi:GT2 family glycosyltransferase
MKLFVIIVSYNGAPWIRGALQSLRDSITPCTAVVVENASTDGTPDIVSREFPEAVLIRSPSNLGFGRGNNLGIAQALRDGAEAIFLLNQDAFVTPDALGLLIDFLHREPGFAIVSPLHCSPNTEQIDLRTLGGYLQRHATAFLSDAALGRLQPHYPIHGINAAAWMLRASVFRTVGGFDPLFFMYGEDDDLMARFAQHGLRTALLPASRVVHLRASPPAPRMTGLRQIHARSERVRSTLLLDLKRPGAHWLGQCLRLLAAGVIRPFADLLDGHDLQLWLASLWATARVATEIGRARAHARQCSQPGAHFLDPD